MKASTLALAAASIMGVSADFMIYYEDALTIGFNGGNGMGTQPSVSGIKLFDGLPSCSDVNNADGLPIYADASGGGAARCDGCGNDINSDGFNIKQLEINAGRGWGHYTIYQAEGYQLTPANGGPLAGHCQRVKGDRYDCTSGLANSHGSIMFRCYSHLGGLEAI